MDREKVARVKRCQMLVPGYTKSNKHISTSKSGMMICLARITNILLDVEMKQPSLLSALCERNQQS